MRKIKILVSISALLFFSSCIKDVKDTLDSIECASLIAKIDQEDNDSCADAIADIDKILRECGDFFTQEQKDELNFAKENCSDD